MADHNDPNAVNSIFSDIDYSAADLYDLFGWPVNNGNSAAIALTFASVPKAGELDPDLLYRILITSHHRLVWPKPESVSVSSLLRYFEAVKDKYVGELVTSEVRVVPLPGGRARVKFTGFPCGNFSNDVPLNQSVEIRAPD